MYLSLCKIAKTANKIYECCSKKKRPADADRTKGAEHKAEDAYKVKETAF